MLPCQVEWVTRIVGIESRSAIAGRSGARMTTAIASVEAHFVAAPV